MSAKRIIIVGTMAVTITIGGVFTSDRVNANAIHKSSVVHTNGIQPVAPNASIGETDELLATLGLSSEEELHDALYNGQSLADLAAERRVHVQEIIDLQMEQLSAQLDSRLASGSLTPEQYEAHKAELPGIIEQSVYGRMNL
jgi:hypothetical protein